MEFDETNPLAAEQESPAIEDADTTQTDDDLEDIKSLDDDDESVGSDGEGEEEAGETGEEDQPEMAEIEINGKRYQVPAELKDGYLMQADYTRKRQAAAEREREIEARAGEIEAMRNVAQEEMNVRAELIGINQRLEQYANVDWNAWQDEDPHAAQKGYIEYQQLERKAGQIGQYLRNAETQRSEQTQQDTAKRLQETRAFAEKEIPGWTPEIDAKVTEFATKELGFPVDTLIGAYSPPVYRTLHLAWIGAQAIKNGAAKRPASTPIKPLKTVSAKTSGVSTRDPSEMSMAEYDAWAKKRFRD